MYDRVTTGDHHEMRLRTRWLHPRLEDAGIRVTTLLADTDLLPWVASIDMSECEAFLQAVMLSDGSSATNTISCNRSSLREAVQLAAYRCGWSTSTSADKPSEWGTGPRWRINLRHSRRNLRNPV